MKKIVLLSLIILTLSISGCNQSKESKDKLTDVDANQPMKSSRDIEKENDDFLSETGQVSAIVESNNKAKCNQLKDENLRTECENTIIINSAIEDQNRKLCDQIEDESWKTTCLRSIGF